MPLRDKPSYTVQMPACPIDFRSQRIGAIVPGSYCPGKNKRGKSKEPIICTLTVASSAIPPGPGAGDPPGRRGRPLLLFHLLFHLLLCRLGGGSPAPVVGSGCGGTRRRRVTIIIGSSIAGARPLEPRGAAVEARGILAQARQVREGRHGCGGEE